MTRRRLRIDVTGLVQGVGFRPYVQRLARGMSLTGTVKNSGGAVVIEVEGADQVCLNFVTLLVREAPGPSRIQKARAVRIDTKPDEQGFTIVGSDAVDSLTRFVPLDIGICPECQRELEDRSDRRHGYPFTNCCECGPRYSIIKDLPYDRERTAMREFHLCLDCSLEYANEQDRRFHAEPNSCWVCGPQYMYYDQSRMLGGAPGVEAAAEIIKGGGVLAVKGVGGFHLLCGAVEVSAIDRIRTGKTRPAKPLAVMVKDFKQAARVAEIDCATRALMAGPERPIVLVPFKSGLPIEDIAPGLKHIGLMLPNAPIHLMLLNYLGAPVVYTSANRGGEPMIADNHSARRELKGVADAWLIHDRKIVNSSDDSVLRREAGATITLRAGRGRAPQSVAVPGTRDQILALGSDLKSSICLTADGWAHTSQFMGDLEHPRCLDRLRETILGLQKILRIEPDVVACDAHPDYISVELAKELARAGGLPLFKVWHHHAHVAAVMAEYELTDPVIGVAFDGSGWGADGRLWGGEWLVCDRAEFQRAAHFSEFHLPGGEAAIREPWRTAAAYLSALGYESSQISGRLSVAPEAIETVVRQADVGVNTAVTTSCGRLFEIAAVLAAGKLDQSYEGQIASEFEAMARNGQKIDRPYRCHIVEVEGCLEVDHRPAIRSLLADADAGTAASEMSEGWHGAVARAIIDVSLRLREKEGLNEVVLAGGVFSNMRLIQLARGFLEEAGFTVFVPRLIPINDGAIGLGQAVVCAASRTAASTKDFISIGSDQPEGGKDVSWSTG